MSHYIKCHQCGEEGYQYLEDFRRRFRCHSCGLDTYLKLINNKKPLCECSICNVSECSICVSTEHIYSSNYSKSYDETTEHKRQSIKT